MSAVVFCFQQSRVSREDLLLGGNVVDPHTVLLKYLSGLVVKLVIM
jgi:hypothetical protein